MNNTGIIAGLSLLCILALAAAGCTGTAPAAHKTITVTQAQDKTTVQAHVGDTIVLSLPENGTTGYLWNLTTSPGLAVMNDNFVSSDKTGTMAGAGGTRTWEITVNQAGDQWVKGVYSRSWEPVTGSETTFSLTVAAGA